MRTISLRSAQDDWNGKAILLVEGLQKIYGEGANSIFGKFEFGRTRIFYRAEQHEALEKSRLSSRFHATINLQKVSRGNLGRSRFKVLSGARKALRTAIKLRKLIPVENAISIGDGEGVKLRCVEFFQAKFLLEKLVREER